MNKQPTPLRDGPILEHHCNGCKYLSLEKPDSELKTQYHCCNHPVVIETYGCPQYLLGSHPELTLLHPAKTPPHLCPYLQGKEA